MFRHTEYMEKCTREKHATRSVQEKMKFFTEYYNLTVADQSVATAQSHQGSSISKVKIVQVLAYPCGSYKVMDGTSRTFKIMAGPDETSVILIEPTKCNGKPSLIPLELVENLTENYVLNIEKYFYRTCLATGREEQKKLFLSS